MARKIHHDLHIPFEKLGELSPKQLLAIDGPKFITHKCITPENHVGQQTLAVLISHDKWKTMNHRLPNITPNRAGIFFIGDQAYMVLPVEQRDGHAVWHPTPETGLGIITKPGKKAKS